MAPRRINTQMFALRTAPPPHLIVRGCAYRLIKVFKHDFFAATALYEASDSAADRRKLVVKFGREQGLCGLPGQWIGRFLARRERRFHQRVDGMAGVQRWVAPMTPTAYALEYVKGRTLDTLDIPPSGSFFDDLRRTLDELHARGAAYGDMNKRSNIVVTDEGRPVLIDFQISLVDAPDANPLWRWFMGRCVAYLQQMDLYHLYKHKRRLAEDDLTDEQRELSKRRGPMIRFHRWLTTPVRRLRRRFLSHLHRSGRLVSPTAHMENHDQPEKATWRM